MSERRKIEVDQDRVTVLLLINSSLIKKAHSIYATILSNRQAIQQLSPQNRQSILEQYNNINRRLQCNLSVLAYINDTYVNEEAARQPNRLQFPVILSTPPEMPELRSLYKRLQDLYPEAMQFLKLKIQQMKIQQEAQGRPQQGNPQNAGNIPNSGLQTPQGVPISNMQGFPGFQGIAPQSSQPISTPKMQNSQNMPASQALNNQTSTLQAIQNIQNTQDPISGNQDYQNMRNTPSYVANPQTTPNLQSMQGMQTPQNVQRTSNFQNSANQHQVNPQNLFQPQTSRNGNIASHLHNSTQQAHPQGLQQSPQNHAPIQSLPQNRNSAFNHFNMPQNQQQQQQFQSPQMNMSHVTPGSVAANSGRKSASQGQQHMQMNPAQLQSGQQKYNKSPAEAPFTDGISPQMMTKEPELSAYVNLSSFGTGDFKDQEKNAANVPSISPQQILQQQGSTDVSLEFF